MKNSRYIFLNKFRALLDAEQKTNTKGLWNNQELIEYLYMSLDDINIVPPHTNLKLKDLLGNEKTERTLLFRAASFAYFAVFLGELVNNFRVDDDKASDMRCEKFEKKKFRFKKEYDKLINNKIELFSKTHQKLERHYAK